eukprot:TCALIF_11805-PA protein Name:"Similar to ZFHX3 Zinc finger homeobox protein 3 (Homo sapiens)" AED:0.08 eAED:0.10 QI:0/0/0/0.75/1/1/4/0/2625
MIRAHQASGSGGIVPQTAPAAVSSQENNSIVSLPFNICRNQSSYTTPSSSHDDLKSSSQETPFDGVNLANGECEKQTRRNESSYNPCDVENKLSAKPKDECDTNRDVEKFGGKIVYTRNGSAYIIATPDISDEEFVAKHEGTIMDSLDPTDPKVGQESPAYPVISNAVYITKSEAYYKALQSQACELGLERRLPDPPYDTPIVHSYKVISMHQEEKPAKGDHQSSISPVIPDFATPVVPIKPILMCFICKLSFGFADSFQTHCEQEHHLELKNQEKLIMESKNASAIIQMVKTESTQTPTVSFLEPVSTTTPPPLSNESSHSEDVSKANNECKENLSHSVIKGLLSAALTSQMAAAAAVSSVSGASTTASSLADIPRSSAFCSMSPSGLGSPLESMPFPMSLRRSFTPNEAVGSPVSSIHPSSIPSNANMLQGTTIGACPDHVNGRKAGVECHNCDVILNRMPGSMGWNTARNSCKTLKCPKCNWHYKYQETLEIHMKEKHPESETSCIYCITSQQHPRLARGETYTCGYKPYRCEVCNYSTTTKGNLSIHMQSDKHLNNMQELQNGGLLTNHDGQRLPGSTFVGGMSKAKSSWKCDVCNYETSVARNLRIHMTSEKHTHNILVLQQNLKNAGQINQEGRNLSPIPGFYPMFPGLDQMNPSPPVSYPNSPDKNFMLQNQPEAALADMAYLQAVMMQLVNSGYAFGSRPPFGNIERPCIPPMNMNPGSETFTEPEDPNPSTLFSCCICRDFGCESFDQLSQHLTQDRSKGGEMEVSIFLAGNFICKLCNYKTTLKANFQLHCKTDKHLQRLAIFNHIKEGGQRNEWKLKHMNTSNPVHVRCNACDFETFSLHKLQLHGANQGHEISTVLFTHLKNAEANTSSEKRTYRCSLCNFGSSSKIKLMQHVRTSSHLQMEQIHQMKKRSEGMDENTEIGEIFQVHENKEPLERAHSDLKSPMGGKRRLSSPVQEKKCPLCQELHSDYLSLEKHVNQVHSVNPDGLKRLMVLIDGCRWLAATDKSSSSPPSSTTSSPFKDEEKGTNLGTVSEKHLYKFRCKKCSLAFKTREKMNFHAQYHIIRDLTKCRFCYRAFRSLPALINHLEDGHKDVPTDEMVHYKLELMTNPVLLAGVSGQGGLGLNQEGGGNTTASNNINGNNGMVEAGPEEANNRESESKAIEDDSNLMAMAAMTTTSATMGGGGKEDKKTAPNLTQDKGSPFRKLEKTLHYPMEKYLDPNRPYKCDVCKESFTQKNILLVHYNSVSHLHKLKKSLQEQKGLPTTGSQLENAINNLRKDDDDGESKPFKCNICKVAYSQCSTLDIHVRSVLHQTRAARIQELAFSGQIDLSQPLMEHSDQSLNLDPGTHVGLDSLSFKAQSSPRVPSRNSPSSDNVISRHAQNRPLNSRELDDSLSPASPTSKSMTDLLLANQDQAQQNQHLLSFLQSLPNLTSGSDGSLPIKSEELKTLLNSPDSKRSQVLKNLLQNYGFELVMQFNEYHQRRIQKEKEEADKLINEKESPALEMKETPKPLVQVKVEQPKLGSGPTAQSISDTDSSNLIEPKSKCPICNKQFSSIWVLKAHSEEIHKTVVPPEFLERYAKEIRGNIDMESDSESKEEPNKTSKERSVSDSENSLNTPSPKYQNDTVSDRTETDQESSHQEHPAVSSSIAQNAFQKALSAAQQQSQSINPFMLQISQLQGMNPLVAMNLQPPLIPPNRFNGTERQKNKDSPYNFNNPPSTLLNLEEYEKSNDSRLSATTPGPICTSNSNGPGEDAKLEENTSERHANEMSTPTPTHNMANKSAMEDSFQPSSTSSTPGLPPGSPMSVNNSIESPSLNGSALSHMFSNQIGQNSQGLLSQQSLAPNFPLIPTSLGNMTGQIPNFLNPLSSMMGGGELHSGQRSPQSQHGTPSPGKRANRTRFTDYQIKVLQEFFENNAYPKDDDLEYLSKLLHLSPRVIVVWFQNARQKARKIYENQPPLDPAEDGSGRFTRTPGLNYQCKKCLLVFQRYYELIRHQKQHCFKEEDAKRSAQAQKAAAQAAAQFSSATTCGSTVLTPHSEDSNSSFCMDRRMSSPMMFNNNAGGRQSFDGSDDSPMESPFRQEDDGKKITPSMFDQLTRANPLENMDKVAATASFPTYSTSSPFGLLQQKAFNHFSCKDRDSDDFDNESITSSPSSKRKLSDDGDMEEKDESGQPRDKRLRTTILPEQLDFLYQKYQIESNPSRKMLEQIANEVGLRKRVVQVWFQNTRARERKGQFRAHQQVINKRCPFCPALFKVRSALESHLGTKHSDQYIKGEIIIDELPDAEEFSSENEFPKPANTGGPMMRLQNSEFQPIASPVHDLGESMRKYYEDTMKRYMNDLQTSGALQEQNLSSNMKRDSPALDLSSLYCQPAMDLTNNRNFNNENPEEHSESTMETIENRMSDADDENHNLDGNMSPSSPAHHHHGGEGDSSCGNGKSNHDQMSNSKRFRTQMSNIQIKVMKSVFEHHKTPTMSECSTLGKTIGLQKRVVQVWFQNARAKEKKIKQQLQKLMGHEPANFPVAKECLVCGVPCPSEDHMFSKDHLHKIMKAMEEGQIEPESPGEKLNALLVQLQSTMAPSNMSNTKSAVSEVQQTTNANFNSVGSTRESPCNL